VHVVLCETHSLEVTERVQALLEARADIPNLLRIIEAVVDAAIQRHPARLGALWRRRSGPLRRARGSGSRLRPASTPAS